MPENPKWLDDSVQFPRLICEIMANVEISTEEWDDLLVSMDLESEHLHELFDRAHIAWERIKNAS